MRGAQMVRLRNDVRRAATAFLSTLGFGRRCARRITARPACKHETKGDPMYRRTIVSTVLVALALLLAPTAAPPALAAGDAGAKQVIYKTLDGHIHELSV